VLLFSAGLCVVDFNSASLRLLGILYSIARRNELLHFVEFFSRMSQDCYCQLEFALLLGVEEKMLLV
jgi:hypothetical protein